MSPRTEKALELAVAGAIGGWVLATAASQHPHKLFDLLRQRDPTGLGLPNWRFFAPEPAQHDFHLLHRVLRTDGEQTPWIETQPIADRQWSHMVFFADRRREKGMFDVGNEIIQVLTKPELDVTNTVPFELLRNRVEREIAATEAERPLGFQFLLARSTGHDETGEPDYVLTSPFIPLAA